MPTWRPVLGLVVLTGAIIAWRAAGQDDSWPCPGTDAAAAAKSLAVYLRQRGVTVTEQPDGLLRIQQGVTWICQPKLTDEGLDRLVCFAFLRLADTQRDSTALRQYAHELDRKYDLGGFFVDADGDLAFQTQLTFVDNIDAREMDAFYDYLGQVVQLLIRDEQSRLRGFMG